MSIGTALGEARRAAGLTVSQVSRRTRIRETVIHAIEREDFSLCGGDFYARGHVRNIAKVVGMDPEAAVHTFDEAHGGVPQPVRAASVFQAETPIKLRDRRSPNWTAAMIVALAVVVVFGAARMMGSAAGPADIRPASVPSLIVTQAPATPKANAMAEQDPAKRNRNVVVKVKVIKASFLQVLDAKGKKLYQGTVPAGKTVTWKSKDKIRLTIGNAGGVRLNVNGKDLGVPGKTGEIVNRSFGPEVPESS
ncbi:helix-turn-helix domain-containing protein [Rhizohabitans arisaemae]|uniref:helix-turn-helix domain-containing protein n=1 Tax=Rhizohabitans arisaemae TaxID=2720610 RepID=UPI0024B1E9C8|nr:helix-turn-helix domain-containing protein [Rhizohabitans arisaemae]